jgi:hypothetical protein
MVAVLGVAVGAWLLTRNGDGGEAGGEAVGTSIGDPARAAGTGNPPPCPTPDGPGWAEIAARGSSGDRTDTNPAAWRFELVGGGYRQLPSGLWQLVLRLRATNEAVGSMTHYPFYTVLADGTPASLACFQVVQGDTMISPGTSSEALAGFELAAAPGAALTVDIDDHGSHFRIDAEPPPSG